MYRIILHYQVQQVQYTAVLVVTGAADDDDDSPFQLSTSPGCQVNHIPKGNLVY